MSLDPLNQSIVQMVGLYRVATRGTIATLLPAGAEPDKRLSRLVKEEILRVHKRLPGNRSVYQLTKRGAAIANVSPARGRLFGTQSLLKNLGVLLFCHMKGTVRHRVESEELSQTLGVSLPDAAYCLCQVGDKVVIFVCYVPGDKTPIPTIVRHLRKELAAAKKIPVVANAVKDLRYGFALIVSSRQRRKAIMDAVRTRAPDERAPLIKRVRIWVEFVEELGALFGSASPSLGSISDSAAETLLWNT